MVISIHPVVFCIITHPYTYFIDKKNTTCITGLASLCYHNSPTACVSRVFSYILLHAQVNKSKLIPVTHCLLKILAWISLPTYLVFYLATSDVYKHVVGEQTDKMYERLALKGFHHRPRVWTTVCMNPMKWSKPFLFKDNAFSYPCLQHPAMKWCKYVWRTGNWGCMIQESQQRISTGYVVYIIL